MTDIAASVRGRLTNLSKAQGVPLQRLLQRYVNERIVFRLGVSAYRDAFVLKGAMLFVLWADEPHRATKDLDLLGHGAPSEERLRDIFASILGRDTEPSDGLAFDTDKLSVAPIREDKRYGGLRVTTAARLGNARLPVQIDVGFGDAAQAEWADFPSLLGMPTGRVRVYSVYTAVAEKPEAMFQLGRFDSRMKDFFDIDFLAARYRFEGPVFARGLQETCERRGTVVPEDGGASLFEELRAAPEKPAQWSGFVRKSMASTEASFEQTLARVQRFLGDPIAAVSTGRAFEKVWVPGGPWG